VAENIIMKNRRYKRSQKQRRSKELNGWQGDPSKRVNGGSEMGGGGEKGEKLG